MSTEGRKCNVIYLPTKHQRALGARSKVPVRSRSNWNLEMLVFVKGGKPENPEKNPRRKDENQQQTQPTYDAESLRRKGLGGGGGGGEESFQTLPLTLFLFHMHKTISTVKQENERAVSHFFAFQMISLHCKLPKEISPRFLSNACVFNANRSAQGLLIFCHLLTTASLSWGWVPETSKGFHYGQPAP